MTKSRRRASAPVEARPIEIPGAAEQLIDDGAHVAPLQINPQARVADIAAGAAALLGQLHNTLLALSDNGDNPLLANMHRALALQAELACDLLDVVLLQVEPAP